MASLFIAVSSLNTIDSDFLLLSLGFINFCVILFGSPLNTGKLKFLQNNFPEKDINVVSDFIFFSLARALPFLLILVLVIYYILISFSKIELPAISELVIVSICAIISITFEFCRIDRQIERNFLVISSTIILINSVVLVYVSFFEFTPLYYFLLLSVLRGLFVAREMFKRRKRYKNQCKTLNSEGILWKLFNLVRFYWFSVLVTALSGFLPSYFLSFFQAGYLTIYQLAYRVLTAPLSLIITPFVDYIRYSLRGNKLAFKVYISSVGLMSIFNALVILFCFVFSGQISSLVVNDVNYQETFERALFMLSLCLIPGSIYILNTRIAELGCSISVMSTFGLVIHCIYLGLISTFSYYSNFDMFVNSKLMVDFIIFLPVSFIFLFKSERISISTWQKSKL